MADKNKRHCGMFCFSLFHYTFNFYLKDDTTMLRYINSTSRKLYAFEMNPFALTGSGNQAEAPSTSSAANQDMDVFSHVGTFSTSDIYNDFGQSAYRSAEDNRATESFVDSMEGAVGIIEAEWGSDSTPSHSWQTDEDMKAGSYHTMFCLKSSSIYFFFNLKELLFIP